MGVTKPTHRVWRVSRIKSHRNAKTNVYQRQLLIQRVRHEGWTQAAAAAAAGVSVRTVAKWVARAASSLADRSSRPHRQPRRTSLTAEATIVAVRRTRATAWEISRVLRMPRSTVTRVLQRVGLNRVTEPRSGRARAALRVAARRRPAPPRSEAARARRRAWAIASMAIPARYSGSVNPIDSISARMSVGTGAVTVSGSCVTGCVKATRQAWSAWRGNEGAASARP